VRSHKNLKGGATKIGAWHKRLYNVILRSMVDSPPRLNPVFQRYDPPLYFVTFNTWQRRKLLASHEVQFRLIEFARKGERRGILIGRYVIMPDHIHLFVHGTCDFALSQWMRLLKRNLSRAISATPPHWQKGFFDHLIRHSESYAEKWHYVWQNPVRAGFVSSADDWPYQGELAQADAL
jgi:REP element-mobilizing transposase RayT